MMGGVKGDNFIRGIGKGLWEEKAKGQDLKSGYLRSVNRGKCYLSKAKGIQKVVTRGGGRVRKSQKEGKKKCPGGRGKRPRCRLEIRSRKA